MDRQLLQPVHFLVAEHGVGLACARGAVSEHCGVVPVQHCPDQGLDRLLVDLLRRMVLVDLVERVLLLLGAVVNLEHLLVLCFELHLDGIQYDLSQTAATMTESCTLMTS